MDKEDKPKIKYLEHEKVINLLSSIVSVRDKLIFTLIYTYGLRVSELIELRIDHFDLSNKSIEITAQQGREKARYSYLLSDNIVSLYKQWFKQRPASQYPNLIVTKKYKKGEVIFKPISRTMVNKLFKKYCATIRTIEIPADHQHPHVLRHSIAVAMAQSGLQMLDVKEFMRHRSIKSTEIYFEIAREEQKNRNRENAGRIPKLSGGFGYQDKFKQRISQLPIISRGNKI